MDTRFGVFISYQHADTPWVRTLADHLRRAGLEVFLDEMRITREGVLVHTLEDDLLRARNGILVISRASIIHGPIRWEYAAMVERAVAEQQQWLIPALLDTFLPLPLFVQMSRPVAANPVWVDFRGAEGTSYDQRIRELVTAVRAERPQRPPRPRDDSVDENRAAPALLSGHGAWRPRRELERMIEEVWLAEWARPRGEPPRVYPLQAARPRLSRRATSGPPVRAVNTLLRAGGADGDLVDRGQPLEPGGDYKLLVNVGPYDPGSLVLDADEARFDAALLPATASGHWLDVVVSSGDVILDDRRRHPLFLPLAGRSWACKCSPGGRHRCAKQKRDAYVRVPLRMPERACVATVEVAIYFGAAVVHAQALTLPVGVTGASGPHAKVTYSLTSSFARLGEFAERTLSVLLDADHDRTHRMYINGVRLAPFEFRNLSELAASNAMRRARARLFDTHLYQDSDGAWRSHYESTRQSKPDGAYADDLRQLAAAGAELFSALFPDPDDARSLQQMLAHEATARGRPPIVQLAQSTQTQLLIPWQLVYDLDVGSDPARYEPCPSVLEWGPQRPAGTEVPARCPHVEDHGDEPLCPFGFWGFAYVLEVPPSVKTDLPHVVTGDDAQVATIVAASATLDAKETKRHLGVLQGLGGVELPPLTQAVALQERLGGSDIDVVYLYCHGGRVRPEGATAATAVLELGSDRRDRFKPMDVSMWARKHWARDRDHWKRRRPVVVLNGCHTTEMLPDTLADFVVAFVAGRAAGVIGTEVSVDQRFAGAAMELFLTRLHAGATVGQAMRQMRWELLGRGNVMGLAYSPYCAATLALRRAGLGLFADVPDLYKEG